MRRPARIFALAIALMIAPLLSALAAASPAAASSTASSAVSSTASSTVAAAVATPNTAHWVFVTYLPDELWICYYEGNQLVSQGLYQKYSCGGAAPPGQLALWGLTYP